MSCARCKQLKMKCEKIPGQQGCARCTRLGQQCVPGPPSRQGKRARREEISGSSSSSRPPLEVDGLDSALVPFAMPSYSDNLGQIFKLVRRLDEVLARDLHARWPTLVLGLLPSRAEILALLRDWAAVASAQNVHELLQHTLELSSLCGIPISEVVSAPQFMIAPPTVAAPVAAPSSTMRPFPEPPSLSPYDPPPPASVTPPIRSPTQPPPSHCPEAVTARLTRRCFPSLARRIERGPDGLEVLHANQCMEQMVARQAERMREQAEAGPPPVPPGLHPDDEGVLPLAIERLRCGLDAADGAELPSSTSLVRIDSSLANCSTFSAGQRWKPVHVTTSLMLVEGQRWLFQEFEPIASRELVVVEQGDGAACSAESGPLELTCSEQAARAADGSSTKQFTEAKLLAAAGLAAAPPAAAPPANVFPELGLGLGPSPSTSALTDSSALTSPSDNDCEESPLEFIDVRELDSLLCQAEKKKDGLEPGVGQLVGCGSG